MVDLWLSLNVLSFKHDITIYGQETILSIKKAAINKKDWNPMKPGDGRGNRLTQVYTRELRNGEEMSIQR